MATKKKSKSAAMPGWIAQSKEDAAEGIRQIGDLQREYAAQELEMNNQIAAITAQFAPIFEPIKEKIAEKVKGVQVWCEANRAALTDNNRVKTANLITGNVVWRFNPPSVAVTGVEEVLKYLQSDKSLSRFVRMDAAINKTALLADKEAAVLIPGIKIKQGGESFAIEPFEQEAT